MKNVLFVKGVEEAELVGMKHEARGEFAGLAVDGVG